MRNEGIEDWWTQGILLQSVFSQVSAIHIYSWDGMANMHAWYHGMAFSFNTTTTIKTTTWLVFCCAAVIPANAFFNSLAAATLHFGISEQCIVILMMMIVRFIHKKRPRLWWWWSNGCMEEADAMIIMWTQCLALFVHKYLYVSSALLNWKDYWSDVLYCALGQKITQVILA